MDERRLELKVGALLFIAVLGGVGLLYLLGQLSLGGGHRITVDFAHSGGVPSGAPVKLAGVRVGRVKQLQLLPARRDADGEPLPVHMQIEIDGDVFKDVHADTLFVVATQGPLGEPYLDMSVGSAAAPLIKDGAQIRGVDPARMDLLASRLYTFLDAATKIIADDPKAIHELFRKVAGLVGNANTVLEENRPVVTSAIQELGEAAHELKLVSARANVLLAKDGQATQILGDVAVISRQLKKELPPIAEKAQKAMTGAANLAESFSPQDVQKLRDAVARYEKAGETLNDVALRADRILAAVESGQGTLGGMAKDPQVYDDLKGLVSDLKRHPWKIFWKE